MKKTDLFVGYLVSPVGLLRLEATDRALTRIDMLSEKGSQKAGQENQIIRKAKKQLQDYFAGKRESFDLPLSPSGTEFQKRAWQTLQTIPYGQRLSYSEQAARMGWPKAQRAVGSANGRNPIPIVIPCHRVVGKNGSLGGFSSGLPKKRILLALETSRRNSVRA